MSRDDSSVEGLVCRSSAPASLLQTRNFNLIAQVAGEIDMNKCKSCDMDCSGMCAKDWEPLPYKETDWVLVGCYVVSLIVCISLLAVVLL